MEASTRQARQRILAVVTVATLLPRLVVITREIASSHSRPPELRPIMGITPVTKCTPVTADLLPPMCHPCREELRDLLSVVAPDLIRLSNPSRRLGPARKTIQVDQPELRVQASVELESRAGLPTHRPTEDQA